MRRRGLLLLALTSGLIALAVWLWQTVVGAGPPTDPEQGPGLQEQPDLARTDGDREVNAERTLEPDVGGPEDLPDPAAPDPVARDPDFAELHLRVEWSDGTPAPGIGLRMLLWAQADPYVFSRLTHTDDAGLAAFERILPGRVHVTTDRSASVQQQEVFSEELAAGQLTEAVLIIPVGIQMTGHVRDDQGRAVSGADLWLSNSGNWMEGFVVARSGADGSFAIRDAGSMRWVGARKSGHAPSDLVMLLSPDGVDLEMDLMLPGKGGTLQGRVLDSKGEPVPDAIVQIGDEGSGGNWYRTPEGQQAARILLRRERCAEDGSFDLQGVQPGTMPVAVRAPDLAPWSGEITVAPQLTEWLEVVMEQGFTVSGTVRDADGTPREKVEIRTGTFVSFSSRGTRSAEDGTYRLTHLPSGALDLAAVTEDQGNDRTTVTGATGQSLVWDPVLDVRAGISGVVLSERGEPLPEFWVHAQVMRGLPEGTEMSDWEASATTDDQGRFDLPDRAPVAHRVNVRAPGAGLSSAAMVENVMPGGEPLTVRIKDADLPTARLHGILVDPEGRPVTNARFSVWTEGMTSSPILDVDQETGAFEAGPGKPGVWHVHVYAQGFPEQKLELVTLRPEQDLDLGRVTLERGTVLVVRLRFADGAAPGQPSLWVSGEELAGQVAVQLVGDEARSAPMLPGRYTLWAYGDGVALTSLEFDATGEEELREELVLARGVSRTLRLHVPGDAEWQRLGWRVRAADGALIRSGSFPAGDQASFEEAVTLAAGHYALEAWLDDSRPVVQDFEVSDLAREGEVVELALR